MPVAERAVTRPVATKQAVAPLLGGAIEDEDILTAVLGTQRWRRAERGAHDERRWAIQDEDRTGELTRDTRARPVTAADRLRSIPNDRWRST